MIKDNAARRFEHIFEHNETEVALTDATEDNDAGVGALFTPGSLKLHPHAERRAAIPNAKC